MQDREFESQQERDARKTEMGGEGDGELKTGAPSADAEAETHVDASDAVVLPKRFAAHDAKFIQGGGIEMAKRPTSVFLLRQDANFTVDVDGQTLQGRAGDFVGYDPVDGYVWPVKAEYVESHYIEIERMDFIEPDKDPDPEEVTAEVVGPVAVWRRGVSPTEGKIKTNVETGEHQKVSDAEWNALAK